MTTPDTDRHAERRDAEDDRGDLGPGENMTPAEQRAARRLYNVAGIAPARPSPERDAKADAVAKRIEPLPVAFRLCRPAENGFSRKSECAFADEKGKCSRCVYAERACAESIAAYGWDEPEWER